MKRLVGEGLIQKNRIMWDELASLRQILTDFQAQNEELSDGLKQQVRFCGSQHRDLMRRQAQMFLADIRVQAEACGHEVEDLLPELKDQQLRDFVSEGKDYRRSYTGKMDSFSPPATPSTRPPSSGGRSGCSTPDASSGFMPRLPLGRALSLADMEVVAEGIREALQNEHDSLLAAISEQSALLEAEADLRAEAVGRISRGEPSTSKLQDFVNRLQDVAVSPTLRTLTLAGACEPTSPHSQIPGGSNVRRLQALIAQRRLGSPRRPSNPPALGAVPEAHTPTSQSGVSPSAVSAAGYPAGPKKPVDPFFDDPLFAAALGVGC
jgi:hypothetical protein